MLFRKGRLVSIIAFDCGTQSKVATFVEDLGVVIDVIAPPRCKRDEDQDDAFTHFRPFDDELPSVWRDDAPFVQVKHLCDAGVPAGLVSGFGIARVSSATACQSFGVDWAIGFSVSSAKVVSPTSRAASPANFAEGDHPVDL